MAIEEKEHSSGADADRVELNINFRIPPRMPSVYASQMLVQVGQHEVILSFFEIIPPIIIGEPTESHIEQIRKTGVLAECVARVTISKERFSVFADVMQQQAQKLQSQEMVQKDDPNANDHGDKQAS